GALPIWDEFSWGSGSCVNIVLFRSLAAPDDESGGITMPLLAMTVITRLMSSNFPALLNMLLSLDMKGDFTAKKYRWSVTPASMSILLIIFLVPMYHSLEPLTADKGRGSSQRSF